MKRYYITDRKAVGGFHVLIEVIRDQLHLGVDYIQIREKDLPARALFEFTLAVMEVRAAEKRPHMPAKILVNTRADVAVAAGADGVHLTASAPVATLSGLIVARSCHTLEEVSAAQADLVVFGPVFEGHGAGPPTGLPLLQQACKLHPHVFALGGVDWDNAASCIDQGAEGVAGIRLFQEPTL
jgi:thiamine-phosphate pyrophosphorylase